MRTTRRPGFTALQLLVLLALLLLLFALFLPAVVRARVKAEQEARAMNNIKQICLALHNYHGTFNTLPPGVDDNHFSTSARLLPFVEQDNLYKQIDLKKSIDDRANAAARKTQVAVFLSTRDPLKRVSDYGATNYLYNDLIFSLNSKARFPASIPDGTSNTIGVGETLKGDGGTKGDSVQRQYVRLKKDALKGLKDDAGVKYFKDGKHVAGDRCASWMDGRFLQGTFNGRLMPNDERPDVRAGDYGGVSAVRSLDGMTYVGMMDGSARLVNPKISQTTWRYAMDPADGMPLGSDW